MRRSLAAALACSYVVLLAILAVNAAVSLRNASDLVARDTAMRHGLDVELALADLRRSLQEAENGWRGYLLTGDRAFAQPGDVLLERAQTDARSIRKWSAGDPVQTARAASLVESTDDLVRLLDSSLSPHHGVAPRVPWRRALVPERRCEDRLRDLSAQMTADQERSVAALAQAADTSAATTRQRALAAAWCGAVAVTAGYLLLRALLVDRGRAERKIRRLNEELEQRVIERTARLAAANRELEAFSYAVSHDLRAPLRHIAGFAELLKKRAASTLDGATARYVDNIIRAAQHAGRLVDDVLEFGRLGRSELRDAEVDLNDVVSGVRAQLAAETEHRDIEWSIARLPAVRGDATMLRRAWQNLLSNAVKYTRGREHTEIEISCRPVGGEMIFAVADNGAGFDMAYADKLFGVFERVHRSDEFEGTGIGLAHVKRIMERHGGRVWAEGALDRGATFYFTLPCSRCKEIEDVRSAAHSACG